LGSFGINLAPSVAGDRSDSLLVTCGRVVDVPVVDFDFRSEF
jgi:hypothetical protein